MVMRMKSWKKRWNEELDGVVPALRDDVKNTPVSAVEPVENGNTLVLRRRRTGIIAAVAAFLALIVVLVTCLCLVKPKGGNGFVLTVEINPAISLVTDDKGTVTGVIASNADADVVLSSENTELVGKSADEAVVIYADRAARLGYLDFSKNGSAVRIGAYGEKNPENVLKTSETALKEYFKERGVYGVVLAETVSLEEIETRSGIKAKSFQELADGVKDGNILYAAREAEGLDLDALQSLYNQNVVGEKLVDLMEGRLKNNVDLLKKNARDVERLCTLYFEIHEHADNPAMLLKDYWEVKKYYGSELSGEFASLVSDMDAALASYEQDYGVTITSYSDLQRAAGAYAVLSAEKIAEILENFTFEVFESWSDELLEIFQFTGIVPDAELSLIRLPESMEEYFEKISALIASEAEHRIQTFESIYNEARGKIEESDYEGYLNGLIAEYGSLSAYWDATRG